MEVSIIVIILASQSYHITNPIADNDVTVSNNGAGTAVAITVVVLMVAGMCLAHHNSTYY